MAAYKAAPKYTVSTGGKTIVFDWLGAYVTIDPDEIAALDRLVPKWITKEVDEAAPKVVEDGPKPTAPTRPRKSTK
ncbi:preprotein translocase subunit YajC [Paenibacillus sp. CAU 1782]